jgi:ribosomal protein L37E
MKLVRCIKCGQNTTNMLTKICDTCRIKKKIKKKVNK